VAVAATISCAVAMGWRLGALDVYVGEPGSQEGRYRLRSPRSFIVAVTRTERTTVASIGSATATPKPICWKAIVSPIAKPQKAAMMMSAAPVIHRAVEPMPKEMAASVSSVWV
jgi:hypothetical protein